jgi:predicted nucleotidyltransferase
MEAGRSLFDLGELVWDLEDALGCAVDVVTEGGLRAGTVFADRARQEEVPL